MQAGEKMLITFAIIKIGFIDIYIFFFTCLCFKIAEVCVFIFSFSELFLILCGGLFYFTKALAAYSSCTA